MATSGLSTTKSLGVHGHWGFSATFDMVEAMLAIDRSFAELSTMNILLVHPGDIRHILLTASRLRRHFGPSESKPRIRFYLLENNLELIARELILLELLFDVEVPIRQRSNIFLEIFGNLYVQKRTNAYIEVLSKRLLTMMGNRCCTLNTIINFEHLSFKQNDELEKVLKYYNRSNIFQVEKYFDHRKRGLYEDRYDSRQAIFDWDYHSTLKRKASIVHIKQYKHWRETGIAFEFGDQKYSEPNKSFMSFTEGFIKAGVDKGSKKEVQGYWGDIVVSPFIGLGISSDTPNRHAEGLYEMYNKDTGTEQHRHHAVEIALYNLFSCLWEIETGNVYTMTKAHDIYSGLGNEESMKFIDIGQDDENEMHPKDCESSSSIEEPVVSCEDDCDISNCNIETNPKKHISTNDIGDLLDDVNDVENEVSRLLNTSRIILELMSLIEIIPLSGSCESCLNRSKWTEHFHAVFLSSRQAQVVDEEYFSKLFTTSHKPLLIVETAKFLAPLNDATKKEFLKKEIELAEKAGFSQLEENPVYRRHRDEKDTEEDLIFFTKRR